MATEQNGHEEWVGSAYLFLESSMDKVVLSEAYTDPKKKVAIYKALQTALSGVWLDRCGSDCGTLWGGPGLRTRFFAFVDLGSDTFRKKDDLGEGLEEG